jgi:hypothetical protein
MASVAADTLWYRIDAELRHFQRRLQALKGCRSQKRWSEELGVPQQTVNCWLSGGVVPRLDQVLRISLVERISLEWLLLGVGEVEREYRLADRPAKGPGNVSGSGELGQVTDRS